MLTDYALAANSVLMHPQFYMPGSLETWLRLGSRARSLMKRFDSGEIIIIIIMGALTWD